MFYKLIAENTITSGNIINSLDYNLINTEKDLYDLPIDGWYWFDTPEEANVFFGIIEE